ncbi:hypothetical protein PFISCL1PPCAC_4282, partial [Pristionchus fissidentatus]
ISDIQAALDYANLAVEAGGIIHPIPAPALLAISTVGLILQGGDQGNGEVLRLIEALSNQMTKLSLQINDNNNNLRLLIVEHEFIRNVIIEAEVLDRLMRDVIKYRTPGAVRSFKEQHHQTKPHSLVLNILSRLGHDATNPLVAAMDADPLRTRKTFDTWKKSIHDVIGMLHLAEKFYKGMIGEFTAEHDRMLDAVSEVKWKLDNFINNYENNYWPHTVERLIGRVADDYQHLGNDAKAVIIRDELERVYTSDHFLVLVYNGCSGYDKHSFRGHIITQFRRGGCNIVVYRRTSLHQGTCWFPARDYENECHTKRREDDSLMRVVDNVKRSIPNSGLVALIKKEHNVAISMKDMPAWFTSVSCDSYNQYDRGSAVRRTGDAWLIVGCT